MNNTMIHNTLVPFGRAFLGGDLVKADFVLLRFSFLTDAFLALGLGSWIDEYSVVNLFPLWS